MSDWNEIKRPFIEALINAYDWNELEAMLQNCCQQRLANLTGKSEGFVRNVEEVMNNAVHAGWLESLAKGALDENKSHTDLQVAAQKILDGIEAEGETFYKHPTANSSADHTNLRTGDTTTVGNISNSSGIAVGPGAKTVVIHGGVNIGFGESEEKENLRPELEPQMVRIPAGPFIMGSDQGKTYEGPQKEIDLKTFYIAIHPVTNEQFENFIRDTGRGATVAMKWYGNKPDSTILNHPVMGVTWFEALEYCKWLKAQTGKRIRLPNEAQWEKAARFTDGRLYPWGNKWEEGRCNSSDEVTAVNAFPAQSEYGCYDMVGNIREWTVTAWGTNVRTPGSEFAYPWRPDIRDCIGEPKTTRRVYRGGRRVKQLDYRCSARGSWLPNRPGPRGNPIGFRVIRLPDD